MNVLSLTHPCSNSGGGEDVSLRTYALHNAAENDVHHFTCGAVLRYLFLAPRVRLPWNFCNDNRDRHYVFIRNKKEEAMINI